MTRAGYVIVTHLAVFTAAVSALVPASPRLIWNATASAPTGLYALHTIRHLHVHELVAVRPPKRIARYLAEAGFLPRGVLLLKQVSALPPSTVCRLGNTITIDQIAIGAAKTRDHLGRPLPRWQGCHRLRSDEVFLMNPAVATSLDGRYFGPLPVTAIVAEAVPFWTDDASDGRFVWHVKPH
jgi:type IV secretory pathway protease TraF